MKNTLRIVTLMTVLYASPVFAATGAQGSELGLVGWIFLGFLALIVTMQLIPAVMMVGSMLVGIFGKAKDRKEVTD
ncbi:MAG: hypothetical protein KAG92_02360 [Deltaproteobacteria bacterium]|nr:hypothetical protein [Deltaproteobacteria bacterium]